MKEKVKAFLIVVAQRQDFWHPTLPVLVCQHHPCLVLLPDVSLRHYPASRSRVGGMIGSMVWSRIEPVTSLAGRELSVTLSPPCPHANDHAGHHHPHVPGSGGGDSEDPDSDPEEAVSARASSLAQLP